MKSLLKPILLSTSLSTVALFSSFSYAVPDFDNALFVTQGKNTVVMFALPHSESEGVQQSILPEQRSTKNNPNPLLPQQTPNNEMPHSCKSKSVSLYELSARFNDKLQSLIAYFNKPSKVNVAKQENKKGDLNTPNFQAKL